MSFTLNGTLFPEGEHSRVGYTGKLRIKREDFRALGAYLANAPTVRNGISDAEEVVLYLKGWTKGRSGREGTYISLVAEPAAAVVRELETRGKMEPKEVTPAF
jgi:hypothetical protein